MAPNWKKIGTRTLDKGFKVADKVGGKANAIAQNLGSEAFWPVEGDAPKELEKGLRILRTFLDEGVASKDTKDGEGKVQQKVVKKIPREVIRSAKGIAVYTSFRSGIAPLSGAGGGGIIIEHNDDGTWSPPAFISPNNFAAGVMLGLDIYDAVLIIRTREAMETFYSHKVTLGSTLGISAGPYGAGVMVESGKEAVPVWSYVKSKGFYAGIEVLGTIVVSRVDEMANFYNWPGITSKDVLTGKVHMPPEARNLISYLDKIDGRKSSFANTPYHAEFSSTSSLPTTGSESRVAATTPMEQTKSHASLFPPPPRRYISNTTSTVSELSTIDDKRPPSVLSNVTSQSTLPQGQTNIAIPPQDKPDEIDIDDSSAPPPYSFHGNNGTDPSQSMPSESTAYPPEKSQSLE